MVQIWGVNIKEVTYSLSSHKTFSKMSLFLDLFKCLEETTVDKGFLHFLRHHKEMNMYLQSFVT